MSRMVRKQIYVELEQDRRLKQRAREQGVTESAIIRRGIEQVSREPVAMPQDRDAWRAELAFIRRRARTKARSQPRKWRREELYADRLERLSR